MKEETVNSQMNHLSLNDSTMDINTKVDKSLINKNSDDNLDSVREKKGRKSITLNLEEQPPTPSSKSSKFNQTPKGILKKSDDNVVYETGRDYYQKIQEKRLTSDPRPHNLEELVRIDSLVPSSIESTFNLDDLSDDDEIYLMEIPKSVNPKLLDGQVLSLTDKSKLKIGNDRYTATQRNIKGNLSCVFSTGKGSTSYKAVNIKPVGMIQVRQKLTVIPIIKPESTEKTKIPLPQNIRHRDPFFGVVSDVKNVKIKSESRKSR